MSQGKRKRKGKSKGTRSPRTSSPRPKDVQLESTPSAPDLSKADAAPVADTPSARRRRRAETPDVSLPLEREKSLGRIFGLLGLVCTALTFVAVAFANRESQDGGGQAVSLFGSGGDDISESEELVDFARGDGDQLLATVLQSASLLLAIAIGLFLLWLVHNRNDIVPRKIRWLTFAGPILFTLSIVVIHIALRDVADEFVASGPQAGEAADDRAEDLRSDSALLLVGGGLDLVGRVVFAMWLGFLSREMMHVELLTRFLGIFGIGAAFAFVLGALGVDIGLAMYIGWLASVSILALGRWPGGRPDGWLYRIEPET